MELFDVKPAERDKYHVTVPSWWTVLDPSRILNTLSSPVLLNAANFVHVHAIQDSHKMISGRQWDGLLKVAMS